MCCSKILVIISFLLPGHIHSLFTTNHPQQTPIDARFFVNSIFLWNRIPANPPYALPNVTNLNINCLYLFLTIYLIFDNYFCKFVLLL